MDRSRQTSFTAIAALFVLAFAGQALAEGAVARPAADPARGHALYQSRCAVCHGVHGDGKGPVASSLEPRPRDFTTGQYRIRSTPPGQPATGADLYRTISRGMNGTAMPAWSGLPSADRWALVDYLQSLSPRFAGDEPASIAIPPAPPVTSDAIARGRLVYERLTCNTCHGETGRGDGPAGAALKDTSGRPVRPYDMTTGRPKRGNAPEDVFVAVRAGIEGTPMPGFDGTVTDDDTWDLVRYVQSLARDASPPYAGQTEGTASVDVPVVAAATAAPDEAVARGAVVYGMFCFACHGVDGKGPIGANFVADPTRLAKSDEVLLKTIREGMTGTVGVMPPWGPVINEGQQRDVLAYIRASFGAPTAPP